MALTYRMHTPDDIPALVKLWNDHAGWDTLTAESWTERLLRPPVGSTAIVVAAGAETGEVVGQFVFIPSLVAIDGKEFSALRPFAPILSPAARSMVGGISPLRQPIVAMYFHAIRALRARGDTLLYMVPDPRWKRLLRVFPFLQLGSFPLWSLWFPLTTAVALPANCRAITIDARDSRIDALWRQSRCLHGCVIVRDTRVLSWKVGGGDYTLTGVERDGELIGLVASKLKGDRQWLICDVLAADSQASMRATLSAAVIVADEQSRAAAPGAIIKVAVLTTPVLEPHVIALGFHRDDYDFPMIVHLLDKSIPKAKVAPERWYVSAND